MRLAHFFIARPIFAAVISIAITLVGAIAGLRLPISEYPEIAPPTVTVSATYPGASAEVIAETVATPLEQEINGVDQMLYLTSQATADGRLTVNVVFRQGTDIDAAQVLVQNRVAVAEPRLPEEVRRLGVVVRKASPDLMMVVHMLSPDGSRDQQYISNYATLNVRDRLARLDGVGDVQVFGARDYAMRVWLDPARIAARSLTPGEVVDALRRANLQVAAGGLNQPPTGAGTGEAFQINVQALGRLATPEQFAEIVVATGAGGAPVRLRDVARVELGSQDYTVNAYLNNQVATAIPIFQRPGSNALATAAEVRDTMEQLGHAFPPGLSYSIVYDTTRFIQQSMEAVTVTFAEAVLLVVLVVILFLQSWRAAIIPLLAIPVSIIGTFAVMAALGISLNTLSMFGLILAIGIVVDDAIVVVENVERHIAAGMEPRAAAYRTMDEVGPWVRRYADQGYDVIKMKCDLEDDVAGWCARIREHAPGMKVIFDPNQRWENSGNARPIIRELEKVGNVLLLEDPVARWMIQDFAELRRFSSIPIVLHVSLPYVFQGQRPYEAINAIAHNAVDGFNFNGGLAGFQVLDHIAATAGVYCWHGSEVDLGILEAMYVHQSAAARSCVWPGDIFGRMIRSHDLLETPLAFEPPFVRVPSDGPGLGVKLDEAALARFRVGERVIA